MTLRGQVIAGCFARFHSNIMAKSSIHISVITAGSEAHNLRQHPMDHIYPELIKDNEQLILKSVSEARKEIEIKCKELSGRKLQKNAEPIREAVVNIKPETRMKDLEALAARLKKDFKIETIQIHIHRDEGKSRNELNYHAHMVLGYQDPQKGTVIKPNPQMLSQIQNVTAEVLGMERGQSSDLKHLHAIQYKNAQEEKKVAEIALKQAEGAKELKQLEAKTAEIALKQKNEIKDFMEMAELSARLGNDAEKYIERSYFMVNEEKTSQNIASILWSKSQLQDKLAKATNEALKVPHLQEQVRSLTTERDLFQLYVARLLVSKDHNFDSVLEPKMRETPSIAAEVQKCLKEREQKKQLKAQQELVKPEPKKNQGMKLT